MPYLLDTNVITQLLKRTSPVVARYRSALGRGERLIAAQANLLRAVVVTRNTRDFTDFQVNVENWEA